MERLQLEFSKSSPLSRDASTAKVGYVIASSGQSLTDTTLLRPSLSICGRRFYHPPRRPSPSLPRILARRKIRLSCERFSATTNLPINRSPFPVGNLPFTPSRENGGANEASSTSVRHLRDETIEERARSSS